jgi:hypothetical protein
MKKKILTILFILNCMLVFGQREIFYDNFKTNQNKWHSVSTANVAVSENKLIISWNEAPEVQDDLTEEQPSREGSMLNSFEFDQNKDFTIETSMTLLSGETGNGMVWNYKDSSNYCRFLITDRDGEYLVVQYVDGVDTDIMQWTACPAVNKNFSKNTLKIRKVGEETIFYINDVEVNRLNLKNTGTKFGFHLGDASGAKLEVDYIKVSSY